MNPAEGRDFWPAKALTRFTTIKSTGSAGFTES
jgi:hypothetical protein